NDGVYETRSEFISQIAEGATQPGGGHTTRTILIDSIRQKLYLSIGSRCNVCRADEPGSQDFQRALIEEWNLDGSGRTTYATGVRNAVGLLLRGGRVWASNNGSDNQGNDIPPEWIDIVREKGFYGYPFAHSHGVFFPITNSSPNDYKSLLPFNAIDSSKVQSMVQPAALIQAHSAPMALISGHAKMPERYRNGVFVALRGSWNRTPATGGKIIYLDFDNEFDTTANFTSDFLTGFMTDSSKSSNWGWARPVGLTFDTQGRMYVGSDANTRFILLVTPPSSTSSIMTESNRSSAPMLVVENGELLVRWNMPSELIHRISVMDIRGSIVAQFESGDVSGGIITLEGLSQGMYFLDVMMKDGSHQMSHAMLMR
ncbi:MAG: PQQ-dependent sugar dehydrogenase, partial [Candidatus Kapaibacteriota bacterium]